MEHVIWTVLALGALLVMFVVCVVGVTFVVRWLECAVANRARKQAG